MDLQDILNIVCMPITDYLVSILNQMSPNDAFPTSFHKIHFNLILHLHLGILKLSLACRFSDRISLLSITYMSVPSYPPRFGLLNRTNHEAP